jgi:hypothetical protein
MPTGAMQHCHNGRVNVEHGKPDPSAEWWTTSEVAAYLDLRVATVSSYRIRGQMPEPDMTLGRTHVWKPSRIIAWHESRPRPGVGGRPAQDHEDTSTAELSEGSALDLLHQACALAELDPREAQLLRVGSNAVYKLTVPVVARISRNGASLEQAKSSIAVAKWLKSVDFPAVRAVDVNQPIVIDGHIVTFWEAVSDDGEQYATVREVAEVFARLHSLKAPESLELPPLDPFENAEQRLDSNDWLTTEDRSFMISKLAELRERYSKLEFVLPPGVIHGDASVGNVLHDYNGNAVLIDLDGFAVGPREWDVVQTAMYYDSFGWHTKDEYETFARVYGFDIMTWPGYPVLREIREFLMVTWVIQQASESEIMAAEGSMRINTLRTGASRKGWRPY